MALEIFVAIIDIGVPQHHSYRFEHPRKRRRFSEEADRFRISRSRTETRRLFSKGSGFVQNIFTYDEASEKAEDFILVEILYFLFNNRKTVGHINVEGYFTCSQVADVLQKLGYIPNDVFIALKSLAKLI